MKIRCARLALASTVCMFLGASFASAQATRTWVSGVGDDANPCSRTAPCKTFAGAISKTAAGGEISVLDPGAYGTVTITKAMTINGAGEQASILGTGTNAITVNAGVNDVVTLRHLEIQGAGTGLHGIRFLAGAALVVDDVAIHGFDTGILVNTGNVVVTRSNISNSRTVGLHAQGGTLSVEGSMISSGNVGVLATSPGTIRLSNNGIYNNLTGMGCGAGTIVSAGDNRKAGNGGGVAAVCAPTMMMVVQ